MIVVPFFTSRLLSIATVWIYEEDPTNELSDEEITGCRQNEYTSFPQMVCCILLYEGYANYYFVSIEII